MPPQMYGNGKKRVMRKFSIHEISGVDIPAQAGASALILKRGDPNARDTRKGSLAQFATDVVDGHQHGIEISCYDNRAHMWVMHAVSEGADTGHDHQLIMGEDGTYSVSENAGHTHVIDTSSLNAVIAALLSKSQSQPEGPDVSQKEFDALKAQNERLGKIVSLDAATKAYFDTLDGTEAQDAFLAKSADDRAAEIKKADDAAKAAKAAEEARKNAEDPVVHTTKAGVDIRKSDGPTMLALAKQGDEDRERLETLTAENAELKKATANADYMKQAREDFAHLPGTAEETAAHLKAIDSIEDEAVRKRAREQLASRNEALAPFFKGVGTAEGGTTADDGGDAQSKLDALTKAYQKDHEGVTFEQAQTAVLETAEGAELYSAIS